MFKLGESQPFDQGYLSFVCGVTFHQGIDEREKGDQSMDLSQLDVVQKKKKKKSMCAP
jgi:hypothetical protein